MCGIIGALAFSAFEKKSEERMRTEAAIFLTTELLQTTVERGKDATGVSLLWADGNYTGLKMGVPSPDFIARFGETEKDFEGFLKIWREYPKQMKAFIGHCRKSSVGNSFDNKNNHPIQIEDIIMVHNGTLTNHEIIFDKLKCDRIGDVDSEAIGRLLHHYSNGGTEPFTLEMIKETTRRLAGSYSVLAMSGNNPFQAVQFREDRPAEMVLVKPLKMVFVASEKKFLENQLFAYNKLAKLYSTSIKFPYIKKNDVEFETLPNDSTVIWDLTSSITDETKMSDLYQATKNPITVDKIWKSATQSAHGMCGYSHFNQYNKSEVSAKNVTSKKNNDTKDNNTTEVGLVWSKSLNKYKTQEGIDDSKKLGAVTVDVSAGTIDKLDIKDAKEDDKNNTYFTEVSSRKVEDLVTNSAIIEESLEDKTKDIPKETSDTITKQSGSDNDKSSTIEVDMASDPEASKSAGDFIDNGLMKYETDDEVADDLEVSSAAILADLPMFALANRIKKFIFKQGFIAGYTAKKSKKMDDSKIVVNRTKIANAEKKIRVMKFVIKILANAITQETKNRPAADITSLINIAISKTFDKTRTVYPNLSNIFSTGDLKKVPIIKEIKENIELKEQAAKENK